ncbi:histidine phosphatase family protein [Mycolicibacterium sp. CBM1]
MPRHVMKVLATVVAAVGLLLGAALPAWAADVITLTWVRHGESTGNVAGAGIDTTVPGPHLTALGEEQALAVAQQLKDGGYDSIYVSDMIRTHETAAPLATLTGLTPIQEGGFREISAGIFEGSPIDSGLGRLGYFLIPAAWTFGLRSLPIPLGEVGTSFDARVDGAIDDVIANGDVKPVIFSHAATIMAWTMMNVDNPDPLLVLTHPLGNTAVVVVTGNPEDGWTLVSWDGIAIDPNPSLVTELFVNFRNLVVAPQDSFFDVTQALRSGDLKAVVDSIRAGVVDIATATVTFARDTVTDIAQAIGAALPAPPGAAVKGRTEKSVPAAGTDAAGGGTVAVQTRTEIDAAQTDDAPATAANGATDLSDGNKTGPAKAAAASRRGGALRAVSDRSGAAGATSTGSGSDGAGKGTGSSARPHQDAA